jgi:molybdate transport system permease protein
MLAVAGSRFHWVSALTIAFLAFFVTVVLVLVGADLLYTDTKALHDVLASPDMRHAIKLTVVTSLTTLGLVVFITTPVGYALSRYRFPGAVVVDAIIDLPIVMPPVVVGISLLVFFGTPVGRWLESLSVFGTHPLDCVYTVKGIVICQFLVCASYAVRSAKAAFDGVDRKLEHLAMTLGCTHGGAFVKVALPMARPGLAAGAVMAWARAMGVFGPLMVFAGAVRGRTQVMPTAVYLELSIGRIETALTISLMMLAMALVALIVIHSIGGARKWWGE